MQKYRIIGANFQSSGCAGAHPHEALDSSLDTRGYVPRKHHN